MEKKMLPIIGTNFYLSEDDENLVKIKNRYGDTHNIEAVKGTKVNIKNSKPNTSVCWGDGETYHFRLTKKVTTTKH